MNLWTYPDNYYGESWPATFVFLSRHRDSDCLTNSNFETALTRLNALPPFETDDDEKTSRFAVHEGHWAVGWVEWIAIHQDDTAAVKLAEEMEASLENYPVLDENDWSEREMEEANQVWKSCYSERERIEYIRKHEEQFEWRDFSDLRALVRGEYFSGYASELLN